MAATFQGTLARNLEYGHTLEISAKTEHDGSWFNITLFSKNQDDDGKTVEGLQMLVYTSINLISFKVADSGWREEAHDELGNGVFLADFKINIIMSEHHFHVSVNNKSISVIPYCVPLSLLDSIKILGHLEYIRQVDHRKYFPYAWPPLQLSEKSVDFSNDQPMSFVPGHIMIINAQLFGNKCGRFVLQLRNGHDSKREELHISVRFDTRTFLRNSRTTKCKDKRTSIEYLGYGTEETSGDFPFDDFYRPFRLAIAFSETHFHIAKDGVYLCQFAHRTANVLPDVVGVKLFGVDGVRVRVNGIDHMQMDDPECNGFEMFSNS